MSAPNAQSNGHADPFAVAHEAEPSQMQAHPEAIRQAMGARIDMLRQQVSAAENNTDQINALLMTEQVKSMTVISENARLAEENATLRARLAEFEGTITEGEKTQES